MDPAIHSRVPAGSAPPALAPESGDGERPLGELMRSLSADAARLVRQEIALARAEARQGARTLARDAALVLAGAALVMLGALALLAAVVIAVGGVLGGRYALGAFLVALVLLPAGGGVAFLGARRARQARLAPEQALAALRDTGAWARAEAAQLRGARAEGGAGGRGPITRGPVRPGTPSEADATDPPPRGEGETDERGTPREDRVRAWRQSQPLPVSAPLWKRVIHEVQADDVVNQAAKVAYYFFLSLPPALMALFGLTGLFGGPQTADWITQRLSASLPAEASALVHGFVNDVVHRSAPGPLSIGLLLALWAGSNVFAALEDTLNTEFGIRAERSWIRKKATAVGMLAACALLFLSGSAVLVAGGGLSGALGLGSVGRTVWGVLQWPLGFALVTATFWLIYYVLPNKDQRGCRMTLVKASAVSALLFVIASAGFRLYMANFGSYSRTYGLLGTIIVLLLWMYVTSLVILLGGEVASEMERS